MSEREIIAYAITHAPKGVKGGPYEGPGTLGDKVSPLSHAMRYADAADAYEDAAWLARQGHDARVIRIVRKAPRRLCDACGFLIEAESRRRTPSEASAVEVLRELVARADARNIGPGVDWTTIDAARRVLASAGPDPMPVVRAALAWVDSRDSADRGRETSALYRSVDAYRKAGGK